MSISKLDLYLFRYRFVLLALAGLFWFAVNIYMWGAIPNADFGYRWLNDKNLQVWEIEPDTPAAAILQDGDVILSIDDEIPDPRGRVYSYPLQSTYTLLLERNGDAFSAELDYPSQVVFGSIAFDYRVPAGLLSGLLLMVSGLACVMNRDGTPTATRMGGIFLLASVTVIGVQGYILGVPGAWILASPLLFLLAVSLIYLALLPRSKPLPHIWQIGMMTAFIVATLLAILGWIEGLFLLPEMSLFDLIGISLYSAGMVAVSASVLILALILFYRWRRADVPSERRQLSILLLFIILGGVPAVLLGFVPRYLTGEIVLPLAIAIALLILCPLGYLYVVFRHDYLSLDPVFSKGVAIFLTLISMLGLYTILYYAARDLVSSETMWAQLLLLAPLTMMVFLVRPISSQLDRVFFGTEIVEELKRLPKIVSQLSIEPTVSMLQAIIRKEADQFEIQQILLAFQSGSGELIITARRNIDEMTNLDVTLAPERFVQRSQEPCHHLFKQYPWAEWLMPVRLHGVRIGYIALSYPKRSPLNNMHRQFFSQLADMLAIASETISRVEFADKRSITIMRARESERRQLAAQIHDSPLQTLTLLKNDLRALSATISRIDANSAEMLSAKVKVLADTSDQLRSICVGLNPPAIDQGLGFIAEDLASRFTRQHDLHVRLNLDLPPDCGESTELAKAAYHIMQESLNNVVRHAQTEVVQISMLIEGDCLRLTIADNGIGADTLATAPLPASREKLGLQNMIEWARYAGGQLSIDSNRSQGTRVAFVAPLRGVS